MQQIKPGDLAFGNCKIILLTSAEYISHTQKIIIYIFYLIPHNFIRIIILLFIVLVETNQINSKYTAGSGTTSATHN